MNDEPSEYEAHLFQMMFLWQECLKTSKEYEKFGLQADDCRNKVFVQLTNIIYSYYISSTLPLIMCQMIHPLRQDALEKLLPNDKEKALFSPLGMITDHKYVETWYAGKKMDFISNIWIVFEDNIDFIYNAIIPLEEADKNKFHTYNRIVSIIKKNSPEFELNDNLQNELKKAFSGEYVQVNAKYNYIISQLNLPDKEAKEMRNFLEFLNTVRNSFHFNGRPLKDRIFTTPFGTIKIEKGKHLDFLSPHNTEQIIRYMTLVFYKIRAHLNHRELIYNTASKVKN